MFHTLVPEGLKLLNLVSSQVFVEEVDEVGHFYLFLFFFSSSFLD